MSLIAPLLTPNLSDVYCLAHTRASAAQQRHHRAAGGSVKPLRCFFPGHACMTINVVSADSLCWTISVALAYSFCCTITIVSADSLRCTLTVVLADSLRLKGDMFCGLLRKYGSGMFVCVKQIKAKTLMFWDLFTLCS
jgi:hypothetical protein